MQCTNHLSSLIPDGIWYNVIQCDTLWCNIWLLVWSKHYFMSVGWCRVVVLKVCVLECEDLLLVVLCLLATLRQVFLCTLNGLGQIGLGKDQAKDSPNLLHRTSPCVTGTLEFKELSTHSSPWSSMVASSTQSHSTNVICRNCHKFWSRCHQDVVSVCDLFWMFCANSFQVVALFAHRSALLIEQCVPGTCHRPWRRRGHSCFPVPRIIYIYIGYNIYI